MEKKEVKEELTKVEKDNNFEEVKVDYQEVELEKKQVRTDSYFDGGLLELIGWRILSFLIKAITLGIGAPWADCMLYSYQFKHTVYNGKRLKFEGTGGDLFVNRFIWIFLTIITLGIYGFFVPVKKTKWVISNLHFEDEDHKKEESFFDGKTIQLIGVNIICKILNLISFGILYPFTICFKYRWINKHTIINRKRLAFDGKAISLFGRYILWWFLTIITFGIFGLWLPIEMLKWQSKNTHIKVVGEVEQKDKSLYIIIPIVIICIIVLSCVLPTLLLNINFSDIKSGEFGEKFEEVFEGFSNNDNGRGERRTLSDVSTGYIDTISIVQENNKYPSAEEVAGNYGARVFVNGNEAWGEISIQNKNGKLVYDKYEINYDRSLGYGEGSVGDSKISIYCKYKEDYISVEISIQDGNEETYIIADGGVY